MTDQQGPVSLRIAGVPAAQETRAGWTADVFEIDGLSRGDGGEAAAEALAPDAVLELELNDGTRILVSAADAGRYFPRRTERGAGGAAVLDVGQALRFSGARPPAGLSRDGLGAWLLKSLRVYRSGPAGMTALAAAGAFQDAQLDDRNGLYQCAAPALTFTPVDALPAAADPILVFIHGTASSTTGSFGDLWRDHERRARLASTYGPRIFAFEHRTLTDSPVTNALALANAIPRGARLHLVSHSRGGLVGELLARANRVGDEPFTDTDIARFQAHAARLGRGSLEEDAMRLRELNGELRARDIRIERFVRVACPARGTTLASGRLDRWASVMLNLLGAGVDAAGKLVPGLAPAGKAFDLLKGFLLAVVKQRANADVLPGLEAQMPDSPLVALLNAPDVTVASPLHVVAGTYQGESLLAWLVDCLSEAFFAGETDLVVNTPSMTGGAQRSPGIFQRAVAGRDVWHLSYFERDESAGALLDALEGRNAGFEPVDLPSRAAISRGGKKPKPREHAPIVYLIPGIMGSHLQRDRDRIWFDPISMCAGRMSRLEIGAPGVDTDGWMDRSYESLARYLAATHEVRPFVYDWRQSIAAAAGRFGQELDRAMDDASRRGQPLRVIGHSMGGLIARLALHGRWDRFKAIAGSRLLQLGTPNNGSHSMATVLMGRDDFVQLIERWFDWKHNMAEFLAIVRDFPGVLELLPWPGTDGVAADGVDYFSPALWTSWHGADQDPKRDKTWVPPQPAPLEQALQVVRALRGADVDPACTLYVAGRAPTPAAVRVVDGQVEVGWTERGDGRVTWKTGIPDGVPAWYVDAAHGDLASAERAFAAYRELLETGDTGRLARTPAGVRGDAPTVFRARPIETHGLYPQPDEVLAAAVGGARPGRRVLAPKEPPAAVRVVHASLACAESPVLIGAYVNDSLRGSAQFLDGHLDRQLSKAFDLGLYPGRLADAKVFPNARPNGRPAGAIVVGLGALGELLPGGLTQALTNGLLEYARGCRVGDAEAGRLQVSTLMVGTGFTGLTLEVGARCLLAAIRRANQALAKVDAPARISCVTVYEDVEDRALAVVEALRDLARDAAFAEAVTFDGRLATAAGGFRARTGASAGHSGAYRVHIVKDASGGLRFTVISDRARNEVAAEPDQHDAVDGMIAAVTKGSQDQPGLSRALFELLVPNSMKEAVADVRSLMMSVDAASAAYPWELMRDSDRPGEPPLATRVELVRQLASPHGRGRVPTVTDRRALIVGDTRSHLPELGGAQAEARAVGEALAAAGIEVTLRLRATADQVFQALFCGGYRFMHLAGHGVVDHGEKRKTGMVLGRDTYLTSAQVAKMRRVPEFVFLNCCHLGSMALDARARWGELATNLATQFIELGCRAVVAAGWEVDDEAAGLFADTFYAGMLAGARFGQAVLKARAAVYDRFPLTSTWGAFQAYGDERYQFHTLGRDAGRAADYVHASPLLSDLQMIGARLQGASEAEKCGYAEQIATLARAARAPHLRSGAVLEAAARALAESGDKSRAIEYYEAALEMEDAGVSLKGVEQLANQQIRLGERKARTPSTRAQGLALMEAGRVRLDQLVALGPTVERLSLIGSYWKRRASVESDRAGARTQRKGSPARAVATTGRDACLQSMTEHYWKAVELGRARTGDRDYYPLLNALDGMILLAARGDRRWLKKHGSELPALLDAARQNAATRYERQPGYFHALARVEADRVDALWACYDGRDRDCLTDQAVRRRIVDGHREVVCRLGTPNERDSTTSQLRFLIDMLPKDGASAAVSAALEALLRDVDALFAKDGRT